MHMATLIALSVAGTAAVLVAAREAGRRFFVRYEYRFDSFSVLGPFGRQLFQIRQSEIESLEPARLGQRLGEAKTWPRSQFAPRVVIRARMVRKPIVISWEGLPIAGLTPEGLKQRSPKPGKRR